MAFVQEKAVAVGVLSGVRYCESVDRRFTHEINERHEKIFLLFFVSFVCFVGNSWNSNLFHQFLK